ncbi:Protein of unknown function [Pyronema omphalodes CBS 100304]|uniref:Uncharacterized protein n=1 Tax=Pyronema omphalodes (strain CBS 100304) TaxID=1076935 RepID=U4KVY8_PYROM|nr:Protein of unknown function [Pyronema omphalodes CBS 100304]
MSEEPEPHKENFSMLNMARQTFGMDSVFSSPSSETFSPRLAYELPGIIVTEDEDPGFVFHVGISKDKIVSGIWEKSKEDDEDDDDDEEEEVEVNVTNLDEVFVESFEKQK